MSDAPETGSGFLVPVFGADLWHGTCVIGITTEQVTSDTANLATWQI